MNAIRLNLDWRWTGCYGEIAILCLFCNLLFALYIFDSFIDYNLFIYPFYINFIHI